MSSVSSFSMFNSKQHLKLRCLQIMTTEISRQNFPHFISIEPLLSESFLQDNTKADIATFIVHTFDQVLSIIIDEFTRKQLFCAEGRNFSVGRRVRLVVLLQCTRSTTSKSHQPGLRCMLWRNLHKNLVLCWKSKY